MVWPSLVRLHFIHPLYRGTSTINVEVNILAGGVYEITKRDNMPVDERTIYFAEYLTKNLAAIQQHKFRVDMVPTLFIQESDGDQKNV